MEQSQEEVEANDIASSVLPKTRECGISVEPLIENCVSTSNELPRSSTSGSSPMLEDNGTSRCALSTKEPEYPSASSYSMSSSRLTIEELVRSNYKIPEPISLSKTSHKPQIQWQRFYQMGAGSKSTKVDANPLSTKQGVVLLSSNELSGKNFNEGRGAVTTEDHNLNIPRNSLSKLVSTSSFSQFFANRSLKGKDIVPKPKAPALDKEVHTAEQASTRMMISSPDVNSNQASFKFSDPGRPTSIHNGVTLREWMNAMGSKINKAERIHIFRQIVKLIDIAHSQGIAFQDLLPSCFILLSPNGIKYIGPSVPIDSINPETNAKRPSNHAENSLTAKQQKVSNDVARSCFRDEGASFKAECLPESNINQLEKKWYTCPEELNHRNLASSNIYSLGVLLFELLCCFESPAAHSAVMLNLQSRILPPNFLSQYPKEVGFCFLLLHPQPSSRPTAREILQSELIQGTEEICKIDGVPSITEMQKEDDPDSDVLLYFLISLQEEKQNHTSKLLQRIEHVEADLKEIGKKDFGSYFKHLNSTGSHSKCEKLINNISQLESAYFCLRSQIQIAGNHAIDRPDKDLLTSRDRFPTKEVESTPKSVDRVRDFFEGICKYARYNKFEEYGMLRNGDLLNSTNVICSLCFDHEEDYIAAAGVSKKIKIFEFASLLDDSEDLQYPVIEMSNNSKLSCVSWNSYMKNYLASTDYDGVVKMWDASTGQGFSQYIEHQKRAWSVDFCRVDPTKFATGSDDCSVKVWNINERSSVDTIWNPANICCVQFSAYSSHMLAFGSADYKIYCYDLRNTRIPWCTLSGHDKAVSYVKFLDYGTLVSASTDNALKLWDLKRTSLEGLSSNACTLTFKGHTNEKNFVGLSVLDGYIVCGSESNEVYAYHRSQPMPITCYKFGSVDPSSVNECESNGQFVSSVCWRRKSNMVVAANSTGCIKLLRLV